MEIETIISVLGLLGLGGIVGSYFQYRLNQLKETDLKLQELNENKYRSILIYMRCALHPEHHNQFTTNDPVFQKLTAKHKVKKYSLLHVREFYYNSLLYASDEVLIKLKQFIETPTETNFMQTALAMRKDLWKKRTNIAVSMLSIE